MAPIAHGREASSLAIAAAFPPAFPRAQAAAKAAPDLTRRLKPKTGLGSVAAAILIIAFVSFFLYDHSELVEETIWYRSLLYSSLGYARDDNGYMFKVELCLLKESFFIRVICPNQNRQRLYTFSTRSSQNVRELNFNYVTYLKLSHPAHSDII
ncbi:hypothetical protein ACMA1I_10500 [Pontibacter sp. 13R65]|uniref:hypothetical protein n=1 Tax=Pontibacter sp. 13R65 TaxID=3127458 RepID=UPI00301E42AE